MDIDSILTPLQLRVAMAALGVTRAALAKALGVLDGEIAALEKRGGTVELAEAVREYFETRELRFRTTAGGVGIWYDGLWLMCSGSADAEAHGMRRASS